MQDISETTTYPVRTKREFYKRLKIVEEEIIRKESSYDVSDTLIEGGLVREVKEKIYGEVSIKSTTMAVDDVTLLERRVSGLLIDDVSGYGALQPLLNNDDIEEIMVIGPNVPVYIYHRRHGMCESNLVFDDARDIESIIIDVARMNGKKVDASNPLLEARLPDGSRVNATLATVSPAGPTITVRKFMSDPFTIIDLIKFGTLDVKVAAFLWLVVEGLGYKAGNILISGGSGSGKTTLLNCLSVFIPARERVITIEDTMELQLPVKHKIALETRLLVGGGEITADILLKNSLRMRPDRIIVNEVRGEETRSLFTAMNTGHDGCMGTIHANSARDTLIRLTNSPMNVPPSMIPSLDLIIMQNTFNSADGMHRKITEIAEVAGREGENVLLNNVYESTAEGGTIKSTGIPSILKQKIARNAGRSGEMINIELERREIFLEYLVSENISKQEDVYRWVQEYYKDPKYLQ